jgi:hypothetical protein
MQHFSARTKTSHIKQYTRIELHRVLNVWRERVAMVYNLT